MMRAGQILNGLAGPMAMSVGTVLSATWFPPHQRTTSTALQATSNYAGVALAFVLGPRLVRDVPADPSAQAIADIKSQVSHYMWIHGACAAAVFAATLLYFPARPASAPSRSADTERVSFVAGLKQLLRHRQFWLIATAYGVITGVYSAWGSYLEPNLQNFLLKDKAQDESGWIGFYSTLAGCAGTVGFGIFADVFTGRMRAILVLMCAASAAMFLWFALACQQIISNSAVMLYLPSVLGGLFLNGTIALFYELGVETTYPIAEGITTALLATMNNVGTMLFLICPEIPGLGNIWANWTLVGACVLGSVLMLFVDEQYRRLSVDRAARTSINAP